MALALAAVLSLGACSDNKAEKTGEKIDKVISNTKDAAKDAGNKVKEAAKDATEKAKELATDAGNAIEDACEKAKEKLDAKDTDC